MIGDIAVIGKAKPHAAGNMTYDATAGLSYTFDQENRLTGAAGYTYTYDGDGNRVRKSNGNLAANGTLYWYMTPGVVAETDLASLKVNPLRLHVCSCERGEAIAAEACSAEYSGRTRAMPTDPMLAVT